MNKALNDACYLASEQPAKQLVLIMDNTNQKPNQKRERMNLCRLDLKLSPLRNSKPRSTPKNSREPTWHFSSSLTFRRRH